MTEEGYELRVAGYEFQDGIPATRNSQLATCNPQPATSRSHLQLMIRLSVENEKFFVVVSRIGPEG
jgi:hypothetical protein